MSSPKHPKNFTVDEVAMWLVAIGLGDLAPEFRSAAVDGGLLTDLGEEDLKEVGCSGLQAKKILRCLEISMDMASGGGGDASARIQQLEAENTQLRAEIHRLQSAHQPPPQQYAPAPAPPPQHKQQPPKGQVVKGAAGGALRGATLGAVAGAIAGDPAKGAKMGAAVGATGGAMNGLGARRRARMGGRFD